jgi:hypothetical protein
MVFLPVFLLIKKSSNYSPPCGKGVRTPFSLGGEGPGMRGK